MDKEFRDTFVDSVKNVVENDLLNEDEYEAILRICRNAADRGIANLTELYLIDSIGGEAQ